MRSAPRPCRAGAGSADVFAARIRGRLSLLAAGLGIAAVAAGVVPASGYAEGTAAIAWGENNYPQLGSGFKSSKERNPVPVTELNTIKQVAAGEDFSLALLANGTVRSWGGNFYGQLGDGSRTSSWRKETTHSTVSELSGVTKLADGWTHAMALLENGEIRTWGTDDEGELGNGTGGTIKHREEETKESPPKESGFTPVAVKGLPEGVVQIVASSGSDYALLQGGEVMAWGHDNALQDGAPADAQKCVTIESGEQPCIRTPTKVKTSAEGAPLKGVVEIAAADDAAYARLENGEIMAWGSNSRGQLGTGAAVSNTVHYYPAVVRTSSGTTLSGVTSLSAGGSRALALLESHEVMGWGSNGDGELGPAEEKEEVCGTTKEPCRVTARPVKGLPSVSAISAGHRYTLALSEGQVYAFGQNGFGQLGNSSTETKHATPTAITGIPPVAAVSAGSNHALALLSSPSEALPAVVGLTAEKEALKVTWSAKSVEFMVRYNAVKNEPPKWSKSEFLGEAVSTWTFGSLPVEPFEVQFCTGAAGSRFCRLLQGTPLP